VSGGERKRCAMAMVRDWFIIFCSTGSFVLIVCFSRSLQEMVTSPKVLFLDGVYNYCSSFWS
jgi:hypothetical protein